MEMLGCQLHNVFGPVGAGISLGPDTKMVVKLTNTLIVHQYDPFSDAGLSGSEIAGKVKSRHVWDGIIDGAHIHKSITNLMGSYKRWQGLRWYVTYLNYVCSVLRYRKLARMQNMRKDMGFVLESTFFDLISTLWIEYRRLIAE